MTKSKRGGAREGAGRPSQDKIKIGYKLAPDVVKFLRENERPASQLIEEAVRKVYKIT